MSKYNHLPIYNVAFSLLKELHIRVPKLNKQYKYTIGSSLLSANIKCIELIVLANNNSLIERKENLKELILKAEEIIILLRVAEELKLFPIVKNYLLLVESATNLARQAEGWRISCSK